MGWFSITSTMRTTSGASIPFALRVADAETLDDLLERLARDGGVIGDRYRVQNASGGRPAVLHERRRVLLTREGIAIASVFDAVDRFKVMD